jgi:hypothetical protein
MTLRPNCTNYGENKWATYVAEKLKKKSFAFLNNVTIYIILSHIFSFKCVVKWVSRQVSHAHEKRILSIKIWEY